MTLELYECSLGYSFKHALMYTHVYTKRLETGGIPGHLTSGTPHTRHIQLCIATTVTPFSMCFLL